MRTRYKLRVRAPSDGSLLAVCNRIKGMSVREDVNRPGSMQISIYLDDDTSVFYGTDVIVEFWRKVDNFNWRKIMVSLMRSTERALGSYGEPSVILYGRGPLDLLNRRIILGFAGTSFTSKTDNAEALYKELVTEQCVASTVARVIPNLTVEVGGTGGNTLDIGMSWSNLLDVLAENAEEGGGDYRIQHIGTNQFEFQWFEPTDRTSINTEGNTPVIFSQTFGNLRLPRRKLSRLNEVNDIYVGGPGTETDRILRNVSDLTAISESPFNRVEGFVNGSNQGTDLGKLDQVGQTALKKSTPEIVSSFEIVQTPWSAFGEHYFLGDIVTVYAFGETLHRKIVGYRMNVKTDNETITLVLAEVVN